jgi:hypothetical protein
MTDPIIPVEDETVREKLARLESLKAMKKDAESEIEVLTMELDAILPKRSTFVSDDGIQFWATKVVGKTTRVDLEYFRTRAPEVFEAITKPALDTAALRRLLRARLIPAEHVRAGIEVTLNKPSVKFTVGQAPEEETENDDDD